MGSIRHALQQATRNSLSHHDIMKLVAALLCLAGTSMALSKHGMCPDKLTTQSGFDMAKFSGVWYENRRYFDDFKQGQQCNKITFVKDKEMTMHDESVNYDGRVIDFWGTVSQSKTTPAALTVASMGALKNTPNFNVLATDYTTYAAVYACTPFHDMKSEDAFIYTRTVTPAKGAVEKGIAAFVAQDLDVEDFEVTSQNC